MGEEVEKSKKEKEREGVKYVASMLMRFTPLFLLDFINTYIYIRVCCFIAFIVAHDTLVLLVSLSLEGLVHFRLNIPHLHHHLVVVVGGGGGIFATVDVAWCVCVRIYACAFATRRIVTYRCELVCECANMCVCVCVVFLCWFESAHFIYTRILYLVIYTYLKYLLHAHTHMRTNTHKHRHTWTACRSKKCNLSKQASLFELTT